MVTEILIRNQDGFYKKQTKKFAVLPPAVPLYKVMWLFQLQPLRYGKNDSLQAQGHHQGLQTRVIT